MLHDYNSFRNEDISSNETLLQAIKNDDLVKAEQLLKSGSDPNSSKIHGEEIIYSAKSMPMIKLLIQYKSWIPSHILCDNIKDTDFIKFCLDSGLDPNVDDSLLLRCAVKKNNLDLVKILVEKYGINLLEYRSSSAMHAAEYGNIDILNYLISKGVTKEYDRVMKWVCNSPTLTKERQLEILDLLQSYIDSGKVTCNPGEVYRTSRTKQTEPISLQEILKRYGNMKNYLVSVYKL